jgi:hypothetical protein
VGDRGRDQWSNVHGAIAHPDSPQGGAGPGVSRSRRPLGSDLSFEPGDLPPPHSPAARYLSQLDLDNRYVAENETGEVYSDMGTAGTGAGTQISDDELGKAMAQDAKDVVGKPTLGTECFDLPDQLLRKNGGKSADDFHRVTGSRNQNYVWGTSADGIDDIREGDTAQFRDHLVTITTTTETKDTFPNGATKTNISTATEQHKRGPQHSAIVIGINDDATLEIAEQHLVDRNTGKPFETVQKNTLHITSSHPHPTRQTRKLADGTVEEVTTKIKIVVTGKVWFYHPKVKRKGK